MNWQDPDAEREAERYDAPIPSRTLIQQTLTEQDSSLSHADLVAHYHLDHPDAIEALSRRLNAMVRDGQLLRTSHIPPQYRLTTDDDVFVGKVQANAKGFGFVVMDNQPDIFLPEKEMRLVFNGDIVKVRPTGTDRRGRLTGYIVEVTVRQQRELIGKVQQYDGDYFIQPAQPNSHQPIAMEPEQIARAGLTVGDSTRIAIDDWPTREEFANGHILANLADQADSQLIIPATVLDFDLPYEFSAEVLAETQKLKEPVAKDRKNRVDLRELPLVTIDGEDARDFDDAVYAEKRPDGGYRLVVAIADVSHYVKTGSALDNEAQARGTSVYFPNHVLPMLPEALSNGLCSLKPNVDRLCMVCDINLSRVGRVTGYTFYPAVMHSQARLTYTQVSDYLGGQTDAILENPAVRKSVNTLFQLYQTLLGLRQSRGAMEFETTETYMTFDALGAIAQILPRKRNDAHRLIEECMLLANVCAADYAIGHEVPVLYRNHEAPESSRVQKVRDYVRLLGLHFPEKPTQADYQAVIEATKDRIDATSIHAVLLRSMMQAFYAPKNLGHFGLAYDSYTHFTSPIRRYPDLLLHRAIKDHLVQRTFELEGQALASAGEHYSMTERRADEASRSVMSWLKCHYMQQHIGEEFDGTITAVTDFGLFVTLNDLYVDGMIHISQLGNDYFVYDAGSQALIGQQHNQRFALGDVVLIKVAGVNIEDRKIDFALLKQKSSQGRQLREKAPRVAAPREKAGTAKKKAVAAAPKDSKTKLKAADKAGVKPAAKKPSKKAKKPNAKPREG